MFWELPQEVFDMIVRHLAGNDLDALSRVSRSLHAALAATIWTGIHVDLDGSDGPIYGSRLHCGNVTRCANIFRRPSAATRHATRLTFRCGFDSFRSWKAPCPHGPRPGTGASWQPAVRWWDERGQRCFNTVIVGATSIVKSLGENQLHAFSWDIGACVTSELIEELGRQHLHLQSLQLATDYKCPGAPEDERRMIDLSPFQHLRRICWTAPAPHHIQALADAIQNNRHHLEELDLDLHDGVYLEAAMAEEYGWVDDRDILIDILSARNRPSSQPVFPSLRVLRLRSAPFDSESTSQGLYRAIDFGALESLSLLDCRRSEQFLAMLRESPTRINLKSLEIQTSTHTGAEVGRFVGSFEGLVDLFMSVGVSILRPPQEDLWHCLSSHRATLKRLVYHKTILLDWVFGPEGIASLEVVAVGDFAHGRNGTYLHNIFVCRRGDSSCWESGCRAYEVFDARDTEHKHEWAALVHPHRSFLEACPGGSFLPQKRYAF
ncbi:hypothetical protein C8A01DRAFT_40172 [Parachaetomium inaequale]|uniref:F-box domain-containing protein n=1 Tax=Parachaetomium inaequale TaxID=2588326 RepID=A0AAN6SM22_9PEZI|nr:hypothetical protein C8A01DRAFT_40172 [Parachaetomium inaequale]